MSGIAQQSAFPGSQEDGWGIYHVWHEEQSGVDLPRLNTKMNSPKMGFKQAHSCLGEAAVLPMIKSSLKNVCTQGDDANKPLQIMQLQYLPKHF